MWTIILRRPCTLLEKNVEGTARTRDERDEHSVRKDSTQDLPCRQASRTEISLDSGVQGEDIAESEIAGYGASSPCFLESVLCLQESAKALLSRVQLCVATTGSSSHTHVTIRDTSLTALMGLEAPGSKKGSRARTTRRKGGAEGKS